MNLAAFSIKRPVLITVTVLVTILLGMVASLRLPMDLLPNLNPPIVAVVTVFPGASASEMAELVAKPIEDAAATTPGVENLHSIAQENLATVVVQFGWGTNMNQAREELRTRIDRVVLPEGLNRPVLTKFDPSSVPVLQLNIASSQDAANLTRLTREKVIPRLETVDGVANISLLGATDEQVRVNLIQAKLEEYRLSPAQVAGVIKASNLNIPTGNIKESGKQLSIRVVGKLTSLTELENLEVARVPVVPAVAQPPASPAAMPTVPVRLKDVATVTLGYADATSLVRQDGKATVGLAIMKESGANTVAVADGIQEALDDLLKAVPELSVTTVSDTAEIIRSSIYDLGRDLALGGFLAVAILWLFLRSLRTTLINAISIPISGVFTLLLLYLTGRGLNIMTLGGLTLAVGLIIDDSIVVVEAIHRHLDRGKRPADAARDGTAEVVTAVIASTLTTVAVFLPVAFVPGIAGELFKDLALAVSMSLLASLVVSLTVVPMVASRVLKPRELVVEGEPAQNVVPDSALARGYRGLLDWVLQNRAVTLLLATAVLAASLRLAPEIGTEFIPMTDEGQFQITLKMPAGTALNTTADKVQQIEKVLAEHRSVETYSVTIGSGEGLDAMLGGGSESGPAKAVFTVTRETDKDVSTEEVMAEIRRETDKIAEPAQVTFNIQSAIVQSAGGMDAGVQVTVSAPDRPTLEKYLPQVEKAVASVDGVTGVRNNLATTRPEVQIVVDRAKALQYGLTPAQVGMGASLAVKGQTVSRFESGEGSFDIFLSLRPEERQTQSNLQDLRITSPMGRSVRLGDIAAVQQGEGPVSITRDDRRVAAQITGFFEGRDLGSVSADIRASVDDLDLPDTITVSQAGLADLMQDGFKGLAFALILAVILVFLIMAAEFESFRHPLVILLALPLAVTGVLGGMWLSGYHFGITAFIGVIMLVGIVVKNGIIMIDYINHLKLSGYSTRAAVLDGAAVRVRPVLMTALAAALGLLPLAFGMGGSGAKLMTPLAVAVVGGLVSSTLLTLVVVPVVYTFFEGGFVPASVRRHGRAFRRTLDEEEELDLSVVAGALDNHRVELSEAESRVLASLLRKLKEGSSREPGGVQHTE